MIDNKPVTVSHVYQGNRLISTIVPLDRNSEPPYVSLFTRRCRTSDSWPASGQRSQHPDVQDLDVQHLDAQHLDLGPLSVLSSCEFEVLVLIGHGHSVPETAKLLHRSPRTIEQHKVSIGRKLGSSAIADIVRTIHQVGLRMDDVNLKRLSALRPEYRKAQS